MELCCCCYVAQAVNNVLCILLNWIEDYLNVSMNGVLLSVFLNYDLVSRILSVSLAMLPGVCSLVCEVNFMRNFLLLFLRSFSHHCVSGIFCFLLEVGGLLQVLFLYWQFMVIIISTFMLFREFLSDFSRLVFLVSWYFFLHLTRCSIVFASKRDRLLMLLPANSVKFNNCFRFLVFLLGVSTVQFSSFVVALCLVGLRDGFIVASIYFSAWYV